MHLCLFWIISLRNRQFTQISQNPISWMNLIGSWLTCFPSPERNAAECWCLAAAPRLSPGEPGVPPAPSAGSEWSPTHGQATHKNNLSDSWLNVKKQPHVQYIHKSDYTLTKHNSVSFHCSFVSDFTLFGSNLSLQCYLFNNVTPNSVFFDNLK